MSYTEAETIWPQSYQSLAPSKWRCNYHGVFLPKPPRKALVGQMRQPLGLIFHDLAEQKGGRIVEGHLLVDHVHKVPGDSTQALSRLGDGVDQGQKHDHDGTTL